MNRQLMKKYTYRVNFLINSKEQNRKKYKSCLNHIYIIRQTTEKKKVKKKNVHLVFVAYDTVPRKELYRAPALAPARMGIPSTLTQAMEKIYN